MKVLIGMECSGVIRDAFTLKGHYAVSCDLLPSKTSGSHRQEDIRFGILKENWDLIILHPDCTYLCNSGIHWNKRIPERSKKTEEALNFVEWLWKEACEQAVYVALENPVGILSTRSSLGKPSQIIQPYQFGDDASKATCLWLKNLPKLTPTKFILPKIINGKHRWGNQTDSGQNKESPSKDRWFKRAKTYSGIALAMAEQWG